MRFKAKDAPSPTYMFDFEAIDKLESLTPREIVTLICSVVGVRPENAYTLEDRPPHPNVMHLFKEFKV